MVDDASFPCRGCLAASGNPVLDFGQTKRPTLAIPTFHFSLLPCTACYIFFARSSFPSIFITTPPESLTTTLSNNSTCLVDQPEVLPTRPPALLQLTLKTLASPRPASVTKRYAITFSRASGPVKPTSKYRKMKAATKSLFRQIYPLLETVELTGQYHIFATHKPSYHPIVFGADVGHGANNRAVSASVTTIPERSEIYIWVRSLTGVTTDWASFKMFIEDLMKRRKNNVKLFVWAGMEAAALQAKFSPIAHGRLGYGMEIDVDQFVANKTDDEILHSLCRTFGRVNSGKMTVPEANAASRPSGRNTFNKEAGKTITNHGIFRDFLR
ncbi:hypothetical protein D6C84_06138 [Aureobasidium pullulans]|uniref:Uncharacterized protein n=1 Tax=Aureobasidium pullulans TaxID=5580 RepID=A0A4S9XPS9_AURPU|nr:hypothetical protein D6C84_06138 [Aureobasidium pullulans]